MSRALIQPELRFAWKGPSLLIVNNRGECGGEQTLSGYYHREARALSTLRFEMDGDPPWLCEAASESPDSLSFLFIHPEMTRFGGGGSGQSGDEVTADRHGIPHRSLDVRARYTVGIPALYIDVALTNRSRETVEIEAGWALGADFADIQEAQAGERRQEAEVSVKAAASSLTYIYGDPVLGYRTRVSAAGPAGWRTSAARLTTRLRLEPRQTAALKLRVEPFAAAGSLGADEVGARDACLREWRDGLARITTPGNLLAERIITANIRDFASFPLMEGEPDEWLALQAGIPLYPALFGRDTLTAGWQAAFLDRGRSLDASMTRLGRMQSDRVDDRHDEEPGRIPFQVRRGPLALLDINPFAAYYADYASPLMFVVSLAHLYAWTGEKETLRRHWDTARRILDWARVHADMDGDGYLEYRTRSADGPKNQGWKDSGDAIVYEDGSPVPAPIATCDLQGYWFAAQQLMAVLSWQMGEREDAKEHWRNAMELKERFNREWWIESDGFFAIAMDPEKRLVHAASSNAAHCLAAGIVSDAHLPRVVGRLFAPDLFSGWGIRTLSSEHVSYNPIGYHVGSVWAVEQATTMLGLRRYGFDERAVELARALFDLAELYPEYRIPECVGGYARGERSFPGAYPRANTPQLWNATALPLLVHALLGLQPVAPLDLLVIDPVLPTWLPEVVVHDLAIGGAVVTLRFWRDGGGASHAEVLHRRGTLHLVRQPPPESLTAGAGDRFRALVDGLLHH